MIEKDFVPYEEALALKELGFDEKCFCNWEESWSPEPEHEIRMVLTTEQTWLRPGWIHAPTFSQAFRFFRNKHNINAQIAFCEYSVSSENSWKFTFDNPTNVLIWNGKFNTYEEAELECLKVLIEMVKTK